MPKSCVRWHWKTLPDLTDELNRMVILIRKRKIRVCRNIPAKCKDVFDSALFQLMDYSMYLFSCGRDAGQMCDCRHPIRVDRICNLYGIITGSAGCSICAADICRFQLCDFCCNCLIILQLEYGGTTDAPADKRGADFRRDSIAPEAMQGAF